MTEHAQFVGSIPQHYDEDLGPVMFVDYAADMARRAAESRPGTVLELAAGTGILTRQLRDAIPADSHIMATDLNDAMLTVAQAKFEPGENVSFRAVDATDLPFGDGAFDLVACQFGVMFFPDKARSYSEVHRVLRPGGRYVFNVWGSFAENPFAEVAHETIAGFFKGDPPGFYKVPFSYADTDVIQNALNEAGFSGVEIERLPTQRSIPSVASFARGIVNGNPTIDEVRREGADPAEIEAAVFKALLKAFGPEPCTMPLEAIAISATG